MPLPSPEHLALKIGSAVSIQNPIIGFFYYYYFFCKRDRGAAHPAHFPASWFSLCFACMGNTSPWHCMGSQVVFPFNNHRNKCWLRHKRGTKPKDLIFLAPAVAFTSTSQPFGSWASPDCLFPCLELFEQQPCECQGKGLGGSPSPSKGTGR